MRSPHRNRQATSGLGRPMSVFDAFIYNFLSMGVIFPWVYVWGPASFPGGNLELGIWLTFLAQTPISLAYCFLAVALPFSGGDYIYQTRAFGKWGFVSVMSGFVFWILQWVALSGWLFAKLGLAPLLMCLGVFMNTPALTALALKVQSSFGIFIISILLTFVTALFLVRGGLRLYARVQKFLFALTLAAVGAIIFVFITRRTSFDHNLNSFAHTLIDQIGSNFKIASSHLIRDNFVQFLMIDVRNSGLDISPQSTWWATLGIIPIAWTSLQWASYSVEQNEEIERSDSFWAQFRIIVLSSFAVALCLSVIGHFEHRASTHGFMTAASAVYWQELGSPESVSIVKDVLQPFPNVLAMAISQSPLICIIIAVGFLANAFQVTCNCFIGVTRILKAMSDDRVLPEKLGLKPQTPHDTVSARAYWLYFFASIPWIVCFNFVPGWTNYSLGVTLACGYVFTISSLAATRINIGTRKNQLRVPFGHGIRILAKMMGYVGFTLGSWMVIAYFWFPQLGLTGDTPYLVVLGIILVSYLIYAFAESRFEWLKERLRKAPTQIDPP